MIFCIHSWERISNPKHLRYNIDTGTEVLTALCKCKICGKQKQKKFIWHTIGHLFAR